ncbi:MAG: inorganic phosphate transporter [Chitinophagales bacterium]|mgnify:CR=1 FL=1|nr:inorganic phosphate transporter [Chitinophagales bacterium]MCB9021580.1 inorganic phosphate transporter [Chitinophagales bacterium]MCB9031167.1 inorganic phosphate transporter [Chitinophagales bacterium]HRX23100.1 inorganic phosphate transporter [Chitinophagales bacterium]
MCVEPAGIYIIFLVVLFILAISDLIVGVSNDAVNFLNSAIGAKVASRRTILIVAGLGIALGATFSSGMMEVARKGIFNPQMFMFDEIMVIFVAVMLTDILLLDFFNTFGLPTSTTVSIVFELLGSATAIAAYKIVTENGSWSSLGDYINQEQAIFIISGIFISVLVAFAVGLVVQYLTRLIFTFDYEKQMRKFGGIFGGIAITVIVDFILLKGAKGTSFMPASAVTWIEQNTMLINGVGFIVWTIVCQIAIVVFRMNILRFIVLLGTFALAMAFAGNDLVNFIGVPIAGLISYQHWAGSGVAPDALGMDFLATSVRTDTYLLVLAGTIMTLTLIFSRKARSVTATSVDLGRQGLGTERFRPNWLSRMIVGGSISLGNAGRSIMPGSVNKGIEKRFSNSDGLSGGEKDKPAFDLVRASVNLMVAAVLIAFATSLKLPLSTTYVSFMVAMGASLSDRAWNRDSAVYRVAGVVNVIGGWFLTAIVAFSCSALVALFIINTGVIGLLLVGALVLFFVIRSSRIHKKMEAEKDESWAGIIDGNQIELDVLKTETAGYIRSTFKLIYDLYEDLIQTLEAEKSGHIDRYRKELKKLRKQVRDVQTSMYVRLQKLNTGGDAGLRYVELMHELQNVQQPIQLIATMTIDHLRNFHHPVAESQLEELDKVRIAMLEHARLWQHALDESDPDIQWSTDSTLERIIDDCLSRQIDAVRTGESGYRNSLLVNSLLLESKNLRLHAERLLAAYRKMK